MASSASEDELLRSVARQNAQSILLERQRAADALRESEERYRSLMEAITSVVWTTDAEGRFTVPQPSWSQYTGQSWEELHGDGWTKAIHPDDRERIRGLWDEARAARRKYQFDGRIWHAASGTYRHFEARGVPIPNADGSVREWVGQLLDVESRKQSENALRQLAAELSDADRHKNEFLAMLAHELRNPLAPIRNALGVIRGSPRDLTAVQSASAMMERQLGQMVRLVDDLLDVSRISRGKIELRRGRIELASAVNHAVDAARSYFDAMNHTLTVTLPNEPLYVHADPTRIAQVVGNLLTNAGKFSEKGGRVWLTVELEGDCAVIRVRDNGIGIPADQLLRIFDLFVQLDTSLERSVSGLGIGLTLVKTLVEMHHGTVEAESAGPGRGSEFVVRLPALSTAPEDLPAEPARLARAATPRRVLIVDDNRDSARSLALLLEMAGHLTKTAFDGVEAVKAAAAFNPEVVLLDIGLPLLNGYEAGRQIRARPAGKHISMVALTGWGQDEDRRKSLEAGFNAHLVKPVDLDSLLKIIAAYKPPDGEAHGNA